MKERKNFLKLLLFIFAGISLLAYINFYIDSYCIFNRNLKYQRLEPNQNYLKMNYILKNKQKFDGFLFGSSRVGHIPTEMIKEYKIYNMTYSEGIPIEWKNNIKILLKNDINPKIILLGIDEFDFKVDGKEHKFQKMRKPYENLINPFDKIKEYILENPFTKYNYIKFKDIILKKENKNIEYNLKESGRLFKEESCDAEKEILKNKEIHLNKKVFKQEGPYSKISYDEKILKNVANELKEITKLCCNNNIRLIIFFNPVHIKAHLNSNEKEKYNEIKKYLKKKFNDVEIYDFSDNELFYDNLLWFETSHFNSKVGKYILKEIFKNEDIEIN